MKRYRLDPRKPPRMTATEAKRLDKARVNYADIPRLSDEFFARALQARVAKQQLTIRLDDDVLRWLKSFGKGYQTRINFILRAAMETRAR